MTSSSDHVIALDQSGASIFSIRAHCTTTDMQIQLIDHVKGEKELRERENHWIYKLATLAPHGLNDNDGFYAQNKKCARDKNRLRRVSLVTQF